MSVSNRQRRPGPGSAVVAILLVVVLDASFNWYFWRIPKLTGRSVDYGYQFLLDVHHLSQPKPPGVVRVIAFGSSIDGSFEPDQVQSLLSVAVPDVRWQVGRLLIPGIKPSDWRLFFDAERDALRPDAVVLPLNLADFFNPSFERDVKPQVRYVLPPWPTLLERHAYIPNVSGQLDLALASVSNLYRYRKLIRSSVQDHLKLALQWARAHPATSGYGIYADGYTKQHFGLPIDHARAVDIEYYVHPAWIHQRGRLVLTVSLGGQVLMHRMETQPGWKTLHLNVPATHDRVLNVATDNTWNPRAAGLGDDVRLLGVQLRSPPPLGLDGSAAPLRYPPIDAGEEDDYLRMGKAVGKEFVARWERTLRADTEFGHRVRAYQEIKVGIRNQVFEQTGEYTELEKLVGGFAERGTTVVLVNSPESPLLLSQYEDTPYYGAHVAFLRSLAAKYRGVRFYDLAEALPAEDFNDWQHVNYIGAIKLGPVYAEFVRQAVSDWQALQR